jgi:ketosteroid isomerase-like protein
VPKIWNPSGEVGHTMLIQFQRSHEPADVVTAIWRAWGARDKAGTLALLSNSAVYALYVPQEVLPFGGVTLGRGSISDRLQTILDQFDTLNYQGSLSWAEQGQVHGQVRYHYRHKKTGNCIEGTMRHVVQVRDGLVDQIEEYHDVDRIRAFMRMVAYSAVR